jgi:heme a synthase
MKRHCWSLMNQKHLNQISSFRRISLVTVIAVYFLIFVGGIVRSTGSGMGCPDWPKCFGSWVPPTSESQLPKNYQEIYAAKRVGKNDRFVAQLESLGFNEKADQIKNDKSILVEQPFNAVKTWIEYVNRLIGVAIGVLVILTVWRSLPLFAVDKSIPVISILTLVLVIFQGWIGSIVVSTNLLPWMITVHMMLALLIVGLLLFIHQKAYKLKYPVFHQTEKSSFLYNLLMLGLVLMLGQIVLGTEVREQVDMVAVEFGNMVRGEWIAQLGLEFLIHRSYSLLILGVHVLFFVKVYQHSIRRAGIYKWSQILVFVLLVEIVSGVGMAYFAIPAFLQPIHLLFGSLIIGIQFVLLMQLNSQKSLKLVSVRNEHS